jgi:CubicO group peptidase (beta-lactamase class C family)
MERLIMDRIAVLALILSFQTPPALAQAVWETAQPETVGLDRARLDAMRRALDARNTKTLLIVRRGKIVYEWYASDSGLAVRHYTASLAKALVGGVSLMLALNDGRIGVNDPASRFIPAWKNDPQKSLITIRQLATHSSGIEDAEESGKPHMELPGWKGSLIRFPWRFNGRPSCFHQAAGTPTAIPAWLHSPTRSRRRRNRTFVRYSRSA